MAIVDGDNGDNVLDGTNSADVINGFGGDDILNGLGGSDVLDGGTGNDSLFGGSGTNTLTGGTGADSFIVDAFASFNSAVDTITDFQIGTDLVDVSAWGVSSFDQLQRFFSQTGFDARLDLLYNGQNHDIIFQGINPNNLTAADFTFDTSVAGEVIDIGNDGSTFHLFGGLGNDQITGGTGIDIILAGDGDDLINGSFGTNTLVGGAGVDTFFVAGLGGSQIHIIEDLKTALNRLTFRYGA